MFGGVGKVIVHGWDALRKKAPDKPDRDNEKRELAEPETGDQAAVRDRQKQKMFLPNNFRMASIVGGGLIVAAVIGVAVVRSGSSPPPISTKCSLTVHSGNGAIGSPDALVQYSIDSGVTWQPAGVIAANQAWSAPMSGSDWVSSNVIVNGQGPLGFNAVIYRIIFNLPGPPGDISIDVHSDNWIDIVLNGQAVGSQPVGAVPANFQGPPSSFTSNQLAQGSNTLEFHLGNTSNFEGLDFMATSRYACVTPVAVVSSTPSPTPTPRFTSTPALVLPSPTSISSATATTVPPTATPTPRLTPTPTATCGPAGALGACSPTPVVTSTATPTRTPTCTGGPTSTC
jgi:hypothetical protein